MTSEIVKKGFALAEKEQKDKQIEEVKKIVSKTLERLEEVKKNIKELNDKRKILEMDIEDLKEGKIDRIVERQEKDPKAKEASVVVILKEKEVIREVNPWFWPYTVIWPTTVPVWTGGAVTYANTANFSTLTEGSSQNFVGACSTISCSVAKEATIGTYDVNGHPVHLR
jgi:hypothetical protein